MFLKIPLSFSNKKLTICRVKILVSSSAHLIHQAKFSPSILSFENLHHVLKYLSAFKLTTFFPGVFRISKGTCDPSHASATCRPDASLQSIGYSWIMHRHLTLVMPCALRSPSHIYACGFQLPSWVPQALGSCRFPNGGCLSSQNSDIELDLKYYRWIFSIAVLLLFLLILDDCEGI